MRHDLALRELDLLAKNVGNWPGSQQLLADIWEEKAEVLFCRGAIIEFEQLLVKAVEFRSQMMGRYNMHNAISFEKLSMFARLLGDQKDACFFHASAVEVFSRFSGNHPNAWLLHLSNALLFRGKGDFSTRQELQHCLAIAQKRYSCDHLNLMKIQLTVGKILLEMGLHRQGLEIYEVVDRNLEHQIRVSSMLE
jgi:hypothetical protein